MTEPPSPVASESLPPSPTRLRLLWLGLATVALLAVVGVVWVVGRQDVTRSQPAATHSEADAHEADAHEVEATTGDKHAGDHQPASTEHGAGNAHGGAAEDSIAEEHGAVEEHAHAEVESSAHTGEEAAHGESGGHGSEAAPVSAQTKQVVLSGVAGINLLVVLAAAFVRRQNPPRLPKYLQPQKQGSKP